MKKILKFTVISAFLLMLAGIKVSCNDKDTYPLEDTSWKLAGVVDVETGSLTVLEPKDCRQCFTIRFGRNSTFTGHSSINDLSGTYEIDHKKKTFHFVTIGGTRINETGDGDLFMAALWLVQSFSLQENTLRLYYSDKQNYLLFNQQ